MNPVIYVIAAVAVVVIAVVMTARIMAKKRTEAWQRVAGELGIEFLGKANDVLSRYTEIQMFCEGTSRQFTNAILGDAGDVRITLGDHHYVTGSGKSQQKHTHTVCILQSDQLRLPHCSLRPEVWLLDAVGSLFGVRDIDFDDDPAFSKAYMLQGEDEDAVRGLFTADVRAWFVAHTKRRLFFEACGDTIAFHTGKRRPPEESRQLMEEALEIMNRLATR